MDDKKRQEMLERCAAPWRPQIERVLDLPSGAPMPSALEIMIYAMYWRISLGDQQAVVYAASVAEKVAKYMHPALSAAEVKAKIEEVRNVVYLPQPAETSEEWQSQHKPKMLSGLHSPVRKQH
jgi:hypothetical protein